MIDDRECGYCGAALPVAQAPKVVHVTKVEVKAPDIDVGDVVDNVGARVAGCGTGCVSLITTVIVSLIVAGVFALNFWQTQRRIPPPAPVPAPVIEEPAPEPHPTPRPHPPGKRHKRR